MKKLSIESFVICSSLALTASVLYSQQVKLEFKNVLTGHAGTINSIVFSPNDQYLISGASDGLVGVWPLKNSRQTVQFTRHTTTVPAVACSPDGKLVLAAGRDQYLRMWQFNGSLHELELLNDRYSTYCLAFDPSGKFFAAGGWDGHVRLWDLSVNDFQTVPLAHSGKVKCVAFDRSGAMLASGGTTGIIKLSSVPSGDTVAIFSGHSGDVNGICFSIDGETVASCSSDETIRLWSVKSKMLLRTVTAGQGALRCIAIHPTGNILASGGEKGSIKIWSISSGDILASTVENIGDVYSLSFSRDGAMLAAGGKEQKIVLLNVKTTLPPAPDTIGPVIVLREPMYSRGMKAVVSGNSVNVRGSVYDSSGVEWLKINDSIRVAIDSNGFFRTSVSFGGDSGIVKLTSVDRRGNTSQLQFQVTRQKSNLAEIKQSTAQPSQYRALLFASDSYIEWGPLVNPINDATTIAQELQDSYGFKTLVVKNPVFDDIYTQLRDYAQQLYRDDDELLIFFAGHGYFDPVFNEGFVVASNSKMKDQGRTTYLSHERLKTIVDNIPCKHILLIMDVCFGGTIDRLIATRGEDVYSDVSKPEFLERKLRLKTRKYLTSGAKEYVPDGRPGQHSPFTRKLLEALRSYGGKDGILTFNEILVYLEKVAPEPRAGEFGTNEPGSDFLFIAK